MFGALDTSTSALIANRQRLEVASANLANKDSILDPYGNYDKSPAHNSVYRRRIAVLAPGDPSTGSSNGVHMRQVLLDPAPLKAKHEPGHPYADDGGYVYYPNIDPSIEMINALEASRAYEANITAAEATKSMVNAAIQLLA